jgi:hypothetical protein
MTEPQSSERNIADEIRELGKNLTEVMRTIWESPERKKFQNDILTSISDLGTTLKQEADTFINSPTGQRIKSNADGIRKGIRREEVEARVRGELLSALRMANSQLRQAIEHMESGGTSEAAQQNPPPIPGDEAHREVHPDDVDSGATVS